MQCFYFLFLFFEIGPCILGLKDVGSQYTTTYTNYAGFQVHTSHFTYLCVLNLILYVVLCQRKNKSILIVDIDDQNLMCRYLHPKAPT